MLRARTFRCLTLASIVLLTASCGKKSDENPFADESTRTAGSVLAPEPVDSTGMPVFDDKGAPPEVSLAGAAASAEMPTVPGSSNKLAALSWQTAVHKTPDPGAFILGYLRAGAVVSASDKPQGFKDCKDGWYRIAPFGYVCVSENNATLDLQHELVRAVSRPPDVSQPLPYMYGTVRRPGPIYARLPSREQVNAAEPGHEERMNEWFSTDDDDGASFRADLWHRFEKIESVPDPKELFDTKVNAGIPWFFENGRLPPGNLHGMIKSKDDVVVGQMINHQGFAFIGTAVRDGRRYGITPRLLALPVDRLRPIRGSSFHGYEIPGDIDFPFALVRARKAYAYSFDGGRKRVKSLARRAAIKLTGKQRFHDNVLHFETSDGLWLSDREVSRLDPARRMPKWGKNGERWLDVNVTKQTLVAYDGTKPVFATLVSTGEAGLEDPKTSRATTRGIFRIDRKHVTATMDSDEVGEEFELRDIPYVQYFEGNYALHAAYWHDDFGIPRSHGCINLSPDDARRLFYWTEPRLPPGWHTIRRPLTGSVIFVHP